MISQKKVCTHLNRLNPEALEHNATGFRNNNESGENSHFILLVRVVREIPKATAYQFPDSYKKSAGNPGFSTTIYRTTFHLI